MQCVGCGKSRPTRYAGFTRVIGMAVVMRMDRVEGELCDPCLTATSGNFVRETSLAGWFGVKSAMTTLFVIPANAAECRRVRHADHNPAEPDEVAAARSELRAEAARRAHRAVFWWTAAGYALVPLVICVVAVIATSKTVSDALPVAGMVCAVLGLPSAGMVAAALWHGGVSRKLVRSAIGEDVWPAVTRSK